MPADQGRPVASHPAAHRLPGDPLDAGGERRLGGVVDVHQHGIADDLRPAGTVRESSSRGAGPLQIATRSAATMPSASAFRTAALTCSASAAGRR